MSFEEIATVDVLAGGLGGKDGSKLADLTRTPNLCSRVSVHSDYSRL